MTNQKGPLSLLFALSALFASLSFLNSQSAWPASIQSISGEAVLEEASGKADLNAETKLPILIHPGDRLTTAADGKARIVLDDRSEIDMAGSTQLEIPQVSKPQAGAITPKLNLLYGMLRALVRKHLPTAPAWQMRARDTVLGVRGTEFVTMAGMAGPDKGDSTRLCTFTGVVDVQTSARKSAVVPAGQGVVIDADGDVSDPVTMDPSQMDYWRQQTLVDRASSVSTRRRGLGRDWQWAGPVEVEYLDPNALYSEQRKLAFHGTLWAHAVKVGNNADFGQGALGQSNPPSPDTSITGTAVGSALWVPHPFALIYAEPVATGKLGHANPDGTGLQLNQGFVLVRAHSSHSLAVGRQQWLFGDGLLIGNDPWEPFTRRYDGVLGTLRTAPLRARAFFSSLEDRETSLNMSDWMAGVYADSSRLPLQLYAIDVRRGGASVFDLRTANNFQASYLTLGERLEWAPWRSWFLNNEFALETGSITPSVGATSESLAATLFYLDAGTTWRLGPVDGLVKLVFLRASGDGAPGQGKFGAFIPLMNDTHRFLGLVNAFPEIRNIQRAGGSAAARTLLDGYPLTGQFDLSFFSRAETNDVTYPQVVQTAGTSLGTEEDVQLGIELLPHLFTQAGIGLLSPGNAYGAGQSSAYLAFLASQYRL